MPYPILYDLGARLLIRSSYGVPPREAILSGYTPMGNVRAVLPDGRVYTLAMNEYVVLWGRPTDMVLAVQGKGWPNRWTNLCDHVAFEKCCSKPADLVHDYHACWNSADAFLGAWWTDPDSPCAVAGAR